MEKIGDGGKGEGKRIKKGEEGLEGKEWHVKGARGRMSKGDKTDIIETKGKSHPKEVFLLMSLFHSFMYLYSKQPPTFLVLLILLSCVRT